MLLKRMTALADALGLTLLTLAPSESFAFGGGGHGGGFGGGGFHGGGFGGFHGGFGGFHGGFHSGFGGFHAGFGGFPGGFHGGPFVGRGFAGGFHSGFGGFHPRFGGAPGGFPGGFRGGAFIHRGFAGGFHSGFGGFRYAAPGWAWRRGFRGTWGYGGLGVFDCPYCDYGYFDDGAGYAYDGAPEDCYLTHRRFWNGWRYVRRLVQICS